MHILITGATGYIGRHLIDALYHNHKLFCLIHEKGLTSYYKGLKIIKGDLGDYRTVAGLPGRVDVIIHLAQANKTFPKGATELLAVNTVSTQCLADYAYHTGASHFIFASTGSVYTPSQDPLDEESPCVPVNFYSLTKYTSERILTLYSSYFNVTILRLFALYGKGQKKRLIPNIISRVENGIPVILTNEGEPLTNPIYISDLVKIFEQSLSLSGFHVVNAAGPKVISIKEIAKLAGDLLGCKPIFERRLTSQHQNLIASTKKMKMLFNPQDLISPAEGIKLMVQK